MENETLTSTPIYVPSRAVKREWIDYNGHMNVGYYGLAFDQALDHVLEHKLGVGPSFVRESGLGPYVVQCHMHYIAELLEDDRFFIQVLMLDSDAKRMHVYLEMLREDNKSLVATSEQMIVNVDLQARRSAPYPEDRQERIAAFCRAHAILPRSDRIGATLGIRHRPRN